MTSPIQRPSQQPRPGVPAPASETKPGDVGPISAAAPAAPAKAGAPPAASASAPTSFAQAKADPEGSPALPGQGPARPSAKRDGMSFGKGALKPAKADGAGVLEAASPLSPPALGSTAAPTESAPAETASLKEDGAGKAAYPVKWQAEAKLGELMADPRIKDDPKMRLELGKMIGSTQFGELGPKGQVQAFELLQANLDDPAAVKRVRDGVNSLGCLGTKQGRLDVLEGLTKASPLTAETLDATRDLLQSKGFRRLKGSDQELIADGLKQNAANPAYAAAVRGLVEDPKFKGLGSEERTRILERLQQFPNAATADLFRANLGDPATLARAHTACDSMGFVKTPESRQLLLEALGKSSPLPAEVLDKTQALLASPKFASLPAGEQQVLVAGMHRYNADPRYTQSLQKLIEDPKLAALGPPGQSQAIAILRNNLDDVTAPTLIQDVVGQLDKVKDPAGRTEFLAGLAQSSRKIADPDLNIRIGSLLHSPQFAALSASDQRLVTGAVRGGKADPFVLGETLSLLRRTSFQDLGAAEKTAVLSQVKNYPDQRSIENLGRLTSKTFFKDMDLADKQRSCKAIAFVSQHPGDRTVIDNTLERFLGNSAPYTFDWTATDGSYGSAANDKFHFNREYLGAGNGPVDSANADTLHMCTHTFAHEVNHLVNDMPFTKSHAYFTDEYGAFFVGEKAKRGREPTCDEVFDRVQYLVTATEGAYKKIADAMKIPKERDKILADLRAITGDASIDASNWKSKIQGYTADTLPNKGKTAPRPVHPEHPKKTFSLDNA